MTTLRLELFPVEDCKNRRHLNSELFLEPGVSTLQLLLIVLPSDQSPATFATI